MFAKVAVLAVLCLSIWVTAKDSEMEEKKNKYMICMFRCANETGYDLMSGGEDKNAFVDMCKNETTQKFTTCIFKGIGAMDENENFNEKFMAGEYVKGDKVEENVHRCHEEGQALPKDKKGCKACTIMNCLEKIKDLKLKVEEYDEESED